LGNDPETARETVDALIAGKAAQGARKQAIKLQAAIPAALRKRNGYRVTGEGAPRRLKESRQLKRLANATSISVLRFPTGRIRHARPECRRR